MELAIQSHGPHKQSKLLEVCEFLLLSGANPNAYCDYGTMLCFATTIGVNCYFELLKRHGAKVDVFSAAATGDVEDVTTRLRRSSSLARSVDVVGKTPLHYCAGSKVWMDDQLAKERLVKVGKLLLDAGAEINAEFDTPHLHSTPFSYASTLGGNIALAKLLLARGADPGDARLLFDVLRSMNRQDDEFSEIAELLLTQGISINDDYVPGLSLLHGQAQHEDVQATTWLLLHEADVDRQLEDGRTPLHVAADRNNGTAVIELLLRHGAEINARDHLGKTPLAYAHQSEKRRIADLLEKRGGHL
ncbi:MAG: ankyrin repeat domain-containing protein [Pirellulaceae bacterium]